METSALLDQLRIQRDGRPPRRRGRWIALAVVVLLALAAGGWLLRGRLVPPAVRVVAARPAAAGGAGSVLDASGYVTARRQATVSAKITGKITEVLIEEGMRVAEGAVLARLESRELEAEVERLGATLAATRSQIPQLETEIALREELTARRVAEAAAALAAREARLAELRSGARPQEIADAEAALAVREARLAELRRGARPQEIQQAEAEVREARAVRDNARVESERMDRLARQGIVAAQARDTARTALDVAEQRLTHARERLAMVREGPRTEEIGRAAAEVRQAEAALALVREGPRAEEIRRAAAEVRQAEAALRTAQAGELEVALTRQRVATLQANVARDQAALRAAQTQLGDTVIRAPFAGVVVAKSAQPGEMISPISAGGGFTRTGIGTIVDMDSLEIQVDVNEAYINRVKPDQPVEATLNAYPDWKIPGSVIAIIPTADRSKATVKVRIAIRARDPRIVPDMGARVAFLDPEAPPAAAASAAVLVPADAVRPDGSVFVLADGRVARRPVTLGKAAGADREVLAGVKPGERVVVAPPPSLKDGAAVRVAESGP